MTHRFFPSLLLCLIAMALQAAPISQREARRIAQRALQSEVAPLNLSSETKSRLQLKATDADAPAFYLFAQAAGEGFAIVSGDDNLPALLGYSRTGQLDTDQMPPALAFWLSRLDNYVASVRSGELSAEAALTLTADDEAATPVVGPLLTCQWSQDAPYNILCPIAAGASSGANAMVGCVATAMAQIMYRWQWPSSGTGTVSYNCDNYGTQTVDFSQSTYDWSVMKDSYTLIEGKKDYAQTMAKLNYDCGVACHMQYSTEGSGTQDQYAFLAYAYYFRYKASQLKMVWRECCASQEEFDQLIYSELNAGRPLQCSATSSSGSGADAAGHSYVLDGYDSNGYVHINWGWGGYADGYFAIPLMNPASYQFNISQRIITGIEPDTEGTDNVLSQLPMMLEGTPEVQTQSALMNARFNVYLDTLWNMWPSSASVTIGLGLFDLQGNLLENTLISTAFNPATNTLSDFGGVAFSGEPFSCRLTGTYDEGDYVLRVICKRGNASDWLLPDVVGGQKNNWIPVYIHDGSLHFNQVSTAIGEVHAAASAASSDQTIYDLTGRRVAHPAKGGIYIRGGHKYLVR